MAEALGTAFLLAVVVGSGIMAARVAGGNDAWRARQHTGDRRDAHRAHSTFGPVSGAHFNPAVRIAFALRRELSWRQAVAYTAAQIVGGIIGVWAAHAMFDLPILQVSITVRPVRAKVR